MPANFGEIASYHHRMAERYLALAKTARDAGDFYAADYNQQLAARYVEAAEEQKSVMSQQPGRAPAPVAPQPWTQQPKRVAKPAPKVAPVRDPLAAGFFSSFRRSAGSFVTVLHQSLSSANSPLQRLSLNDSPTTPAPGLRG